MTMFRATVNKTFVDPVTEDEILYVYTATGETAESAISLACIYASMVEYGMIADKWQPKDMAFPREQLYQFIQPATLLQIETMYPDAVATGYMNAVAYIQSYFGNMFDIDAMLDAQNTTTPAITLRLALCLSTVTYVLASSPHYSEVIEQHTKQLHYLLRGLKSGQRSMGKAGIAADPNVRVDVIDLVKTGLRP